jgi:hypothetical protein
MIGTVIYDLVEGKQAAPMSWSWAVVVNKMAQAVCVTPEPRRFQRSLVLTSGISHTLAQLMYIRTVPSEKKANAMGVHAR